MNYKVQIKYYNSLIDSECEKGYEVELLSSTTEEDVEVIDEKGKVSYETVTDYLYGAVDVSTKELILTASSQFVIEGSDAMQIALGAFEKQHAKEVAEENYILKAASLVEEKNTKQKQDQVWEEDEVRYKQAEGLPEGWIWKKYNDGSGHLNSPNGEEYFSYDLSTGEYMKTPDSKWEMIILDGPDGKGGRRYYKGGFDDIEKIAVKYIKENVLEKEQTQDYGPTL